MKHFQVSIQLYNEHDFNDSLQYLSLDKTFENTKAKVIGWGYTREDGNGSSPDILHQVDLPIMKNEDCIKESKYSKGDLKHISILPSMMCARSRPGEGRDACNVMITKLGCNLVILMKCIVKEKLNMNFPSINK